MASTQQIRDAFPEPVIGQTAAGHPKCDHSMGVKVAFPSTIGSSGQIALIVHPAQQEAWIVFAAVMKLHGYPIREGASGTANCRNIGNSAFGKPSLHAHLSAIDLNPSKNTGTATDQPPELQQRCARSARSGGTPSSRILPTIGCIGRSTARGHPSPPGST